MKSIFAFSLPLLLNQFVFAQNEPKIIDQIVAQVGDNVILLSDIQSQKLQALQANITITPDMDCEILENLMYQKLLVTQAKLDSIEITDEQVNAEMENRFRYFENQMGGRDKLEAFYGKSVIDLKKEFFPSVKDQLLSQEMERQITSGISVTPKEVEKFFKSLPTDSIPYINAQLSFQQIVIYPEITAADKKAAFDKLNKIREDILVKGKNFTTMAKINSMDPGSAQQGGEIKASRGMMVKAFEAAVFSLKVGDISEVFETEYGYHIVKLMDRKGDDYTCQHILIIPEYSSAALTKAALQIDSCYKDLQAGRLTWEQAVLKYSNDETTKQNGGVITNPYTGQTNWDMEDLSQIDQQIYLMTDQLEKGQYSEPGGYQNFIERKEGVRIVRLMERTEPHLANLQQDYALVKSAAENDKKQRTVNDWIKSKINNAYIKIDETYQLCVFTNPWVK